MGIVIAAAAVAAWICAGVFFAFSDFVMRSLRDSSDAAGIEAMQSINIAVYRSAFLGLLFFQLAMGMLFFVWWYGFGGPGLPALAGGIYIFGTMGVTVAGNIPLNNRLAAIDPKTEDGAAFWAGYVKRWTSLNHLRTGFCVAAAAGWTHAFYAV